MFGGAILLQWRFGSKLNASVRNWMEPGVQVGIINGVSSGLWSVESSVGKLMSGISLKFSVNRVLCLSADALSNTQMLQNCKTCEHFTVKKIGETFSLKATRPS